MEMNTKRIIWISVLAAFFALLGLLGYWALVSNKALAGSKSLVGSWNVTVAPEGMEPFQHGVIFSSDGTMTNMVDTGTIGIGVWKKISNRQYAFTIWQYYKEGESFFQAKVYSTAELSDDKLSYTAPFVFEIYDLEGNLLVRGPGTSTGVRMNVETMPKLP
jgi:hypothetical protein